MPVRLIARLWAVEEEVVVTDGLAGAVATHPSVVRRVWGANEVRQTVRKRGGDGRRYTEVRCRDWGYPPYRVYDDDVVVVE